MSPCILAIDQGTTSSRAIVFSAAGDVLASSQYEFAQHYPQDGWVEHSADDLWKTTVKACDDVIRQTDRSISTIGITNQRETTLLWNRQTGKSVYPAIVWQDRRTAGPCQDLKQQGHETTVSEKTGLLLDPYFSASKIAWILDNVPEARQQAERGELAFGTVDCFLIWKLTGGKVHATDATNASRTLLYNIHTQKWDDELLSLFNLPTSLLPEVKDCAADYGLTHHPVFTKPTPINGVAGDQQAALFGQACYESGMVKSTYGTGCFMVMNTGKQAVRSDNKLLTTVGYRLGGETTYALEGSIFNAGTAIAWLRDALGLIRDVSQIDELVRRTESNQGVYMVPAFTGLGAPHWDPLARGGLFGLTRDTGKAQLVRAALESVCYQTNDLVWAMVQDSGKSPRALRVDGGMAVNDWLLQFLSDITQTPVQRPRIVETTALGAAYLAGLQCGLIGSLEQISTQWQCEHAFAPVMQNNHREAILHGWQLALSRTKSI